MEHERFGDLVACPGCKGPLARAAAGLRCHRCSVEFPVRGGIPVLFPVGDLPGIEPDSIRIKCREEALRTIVRSTRINAGFLKNPHAYYLLYPLLIVAIIAGVSELLFGLGLLCLVDWIVFVWRRRRTLNRDLRSPHRIQTTADLDAIEETYLRAGKAQPTMSDWVDAAQEIWSCSTGPPTESGPGSSGFDDERYVELRRIYDQRGRPDVVLDIGSSDGRACYRFGIGAAGTYVGIDVSVQLMQKFRTKQPNQIGIVGDGGRLPIQDGVIDFLFATETLEHLANPDAAVAEFTRVLSPGGCLVIQSPSAHRLRNLNPFHVLQLLVGFLYPPILLRKIVHENTWHNGITYHWDFTLRDYTRMMVQNGLKRVELSSRGIFVPRSLLCGDVRRFRHKERMLRAFPIIRLLGEDLLLVAEKPA